MSASDKTLSDIHEALAKELLKRVKDGEDEVVDGEIVKVSAKPATLNVVRQFLKDNGVEARPAAGSPLGKLADSLPFTDPSLDEEFAPYQAK